MFLVAKIIKIREIAIDFAEYFFFVEYLLANVKSTKYVITSAMTVV